MSYKKRKKTKHRKTSHILFITFTCIMMFFVFNGIYGLSVVARQAQKNQLAVEEMLKENQAQADEKKEAAVKEMSQSITEPLSTIETEEVDVSQLRITAIGDSVMLAALNEFYAQFPNGLFDAVYGRTIYDGIHVLMDYEESQQLGDVMLFSLGTNSYIEEKDVEELIVHSDGRPVFLLNTYGVSNDSTAKMEAVASRHQNVFMVDWHGLACTNPQWFAYDGLHPDASGSQALVQLVYDTMTADLTQLESMQGNA